MDSPTSLAFNEEIRWIIEEPVMVAWDDPEDPSPRLLSLGQLGSANQKPTVTFWVGEDIAKQKMVFLLQLTVERRVSRRQKAVDLFLVLPPQIFEGDISVPLDRLPSEVRQCMLDGDQGTNDKASKSRWLEMPFAQERPSPVLMNIQPPRAKPFIGTPLHLMILFRSLSQTQRFKVYARHSDPVYSALTSTRPNKIVPSIDIDLDGAYGGEGGKFDDWQQYNRHYFQSGQSNKDLFITPTKSQPVHERTSAPLEGELPPPYSTTSPLKRSRGHSAERHDTKIQRLQDSVELGSPTVVNTPSTASQSVATTVLEPASSPEDLPSSSIKSTRFYRRSELATTGPSPLAQHSMQGLGDSPQMDKGNAVSASLALVRELLPALVTEVLKENMDAFLDSIQVGHDMAEADFREEVDEAKVAFLEKKEEGIHELDDHYQERLAEAQDRLTDARELLETLVADLDQKTLTLQDFLRKGVDVMTKGVLGSILMTKAPVHDANRKSPTVRATEILLRDFGGLPVTDKTKLLTRIADKGFAEVFVTVDDNIRQALVGAWLKPDIDR